MRVLENSVAALVAVSLALGGCSGPMGGLRPQDSIRIEAPQYGPGVGGAPPSNTPNLGAVAYVCGPLILFCAPILIGASAALKANETVITEAAPAERDALRRGMEALKTLQGAQEIFVEEVRTEASSRWHVSPNAATSLFVRLGHVGVRSGPDSEPLLALTATATLRQGTDPTGVTSHFEVVGRFRQPEWRQDPAVLATELRSSCRELARQIVEKFAR